MSGLSDAYDREPSSRSVARAVCLLAGSLVAAVGLVATAASLIVGLGVAEPTAFRVAVLLGGALPLAVFLVPRSTASGGSGGSHSLALAGAGALLGIAGLGLVWTALPAGWTGDLDGLPPVALGTYAVGLVVALGARLAADDGDEQSGRGGGVRATATIRDASTLDGGEDTSASSTSSTSPTSSASSTSPTSPAVGDGGEADDEVEFFDDEEA